MADISGLDFVHALEVVWFDNMPFWYAMQRPTIFCCTFWCKFITCILRRNYKICAYLSIQTAISDQTAPIWTFINVY